MTSTSKAVTEALTVTLPRQKEALENIVKVTENHYQTCTKRHCLTCRVNIYARGGLMKDGA